MKVGVCQVRNSVSVEENFSSILRCLEVFESSNVDLVLFPECSLSGFSAQIGECTFEVIAPYLDAISEWELKHCISVILPTALREGDSVFNTGFVFQEGKRERFYKLGLTESEKKFFSVPKGKSKKVFHIKGLNVAILICFEAQMAPWSFFEKGEAGLILWPGYWGWKETDEWDQQTNEGEPNLLYQNVNAWGLPLIQSNFAFNDLSDQRSSGPQGLSMFVNGDNSLAGQGGHQKESCYILTLEGKRIRDVSVCGFH